MAYSDKVIDHYENPRNVGSASSSLLTEWVKGKTLTEAGEIKNTQIAEELALPPVKIHCSVLAEDAIKAAIHDYQSKHEATPEQKTA
ncbi:MAG: iron-sulfur cluster assembly scaffold protein [Gammaproteobacteria bacterium]